MNDQRAGSGWYTDPTGTNELRYFDGQWTDRVAARGNVFTQPLPVVSSAAWPADASTAATRRKRPTKLWALTAAGAVAATVVVILATRPNHSGASFCGDYAALGDATASAMTGGDMSDVQKLAGMFHKLAGEAPTAARTDLTLLANDMSALERTGSPSMSDEATQAAADRVDAVAQAQCY